MDQWSKEATIGIFWTTKFDNNLNRYDHLISKPAHCLDNLHDEHAWVTGGDTWHTKLMDADGLFYYPRDSEFSIRFGKLK